VGRTVKIILAVVVLGIAAFAGVYLLFFNEDSPDEFVLTPEDEQDEPATDDVNGTWTVAAGSEAGYRVREQLANLPAQSDAVGRTTDVTGTMTIEGNTVTEATFEVDVTTLQSDEERRDDRIRSSGLESDTFPTATFVLTEPVPLGDEPVSATIDVLGDLTVHGVTQPIELAVNATLNGDQIELVGSYTFPFSDFEMTPPNVGGFVTVEDDATLEFHLFLEQEA
jgi:polyisoprenoid-binding protein YceI